MTDMWDATPEPVHQPPSAPTPEPAPAPKPKKRKTGATRRRPSGVTIATVRQVIDAYIAIEAAPENVRRVVGAICGSAEDSVERLVTDVLGSGKARADALSIVAQTRRADGDLEAMRLVGGLSTTESKRVRDVLGALNIDVGRARASDVDTAIDLTQAIRQMNDDDLGVINQAEDILNN